MSEVHKVTRRVFEVDLGRDYGGVFPARIPFSVIDRVQAETNLGLGVLFYQAHTGEIQSRAIATLLFHAIDAAAGEKETRPSLEVVQDAVADMGYLHSVALVLPILDWAMSGGVPVEEEAQDRGKATGAVTAGIPSEGSTATPLDS